MPENRLCINLFRSAKLARAAALLILVASSPISAQGGHNTIYFRSYL
jgi:hypothetical protein